MASERDAARLDELHDTFLHAIVRQAGGVGDSFQAGHGRAGFDADTVPVVASMGSSRGEILNNQIISHFGFVDVFHSINYFRFDVAKIQHKFKTRNIFQSFFSKK